MKTHPIRLLLVLVLLLAAAALPGHAGPVAKGGTIIVKPGKYTLIRNLAGKPVPAKTESFGISITASDVELDLAGYTISAALGLEGKGVGISLSPGVKRVRIHNGRIHNFSNGISTPGAGVEDCLFERLHVTGSGNTAVGVAGAGLVIRQCVISGAGVNGDGIFVFTNPGGFNEIVDCTIHGKASAGSGVSAAAQNGLIVRRCLVTSFNNGFSLTTGCKMFDNLSLGCTTAISGNPQLVGVNN